MGLVPALDPRVEDYLDHIVAPLVGLAPFERRAEVRAEVRAHLDALIDAFGELNVPREEAIPLALRQFGDPTRLGQQMAREWTPRERELSAPSLALALYGTASVAFWWALRTVWPDTIEGALGIFAILYFPLLAGFATGWLAPARPSVGTFKALLVAVAGTIWVTVLTQGDPISLKAGLVLLTLQAGVWMPVTCVAAGVGSWLRARRSARRRQWALK